MARRKIPYSLNESKLISKKFIGHIYVGRVYTEPNKIKVGRTADLVSRLIQLQNEYGNRFEFIYISGELYNCAVAEEVLHQYLVDEHLYREWFHVGSLSLEALFTTIRQLEEWSQAQFELEEFLKGE